MKHTLSTLLVLALVLAVLGPSFAPVAAASTAHPLAALGMVPNAGGTWTALGAVPSARDWQAMAWVGGDQVLLFGGYSLNSETWVYDLSDNTWTEKTPAAGPSARAGTCHGLPGRGPGAPVWRVGWRLLR